MSVDFLNDYMDPTSTLIEEAHDAATNVLHTIIERNFESKLDCAIPAFKDMVSLFH